MPIVRYQIRNEYGLADPDLYGAADKDDPEALLEGVAMAGLVGVLRQLGDLAEFAAQIFHDLHEEVLATSARGHSLMLRVHQLEEEFPAIEKIFLSQISHSRSTQNIGIDWHPNVQIEQNLVTRGDMPRHILDSYEECRGPPQLFTLDKFDIAGAGACLKRYTDPSFFKTDLASSGIMESEIQREKRPRKTKKKGLRSRNGDTLESLMKPDAESRYSVTASEKVPANLSVKRVTLKARPVNSLNSLTGRSYMESILNRLPASHNDGCGNSWSQACNTKSVDSVTEVHEIVMDTSSKDLLFRKGAEAHPTTGQELQARNPNKQKERRLDASTKNSLGWQSDEIKKKSSITGNGSHTFLHDADRKVNQNTVNDGCGLEKVIFPESEQKESTDAWSRTDGSGDHYASDDIASELDNYMDALNTMDSEIEADTERRAKPEPDLLIMKPQRTDSYINHEQQDRKVQSPNLHSLKNSSEALDNNKEDGNLIDEEKSTKAIETYSVCNIASNCSSVPLLSGICENQDITERLKDTEQAVELYTRENMDDKKVCNIKETEMSASICEHREAHCGSQNKETISSPTHFGQQSYTEVQLDNPSSDCTYVGKLVRSNSGSGSAVATKEEKSIISETNSLATKHAESNAITESDLSLANDDLEFASSAEESVPITTLDIPSTSPLQPHRIEGLSYNMGCDHVHENKVSQMNTISGTSEDAQANSVPSLLSEDVISGNVSTDDVQKPPLLFVEEEPSMLTKQDQKKDDGEENFAVESEEFEFLEQETSSGISGDAPKCDIQIPSNQTSELEDHSDPWTLVLHDTEAKLEWSCSDVEPSIGLSIARDALHSSMVLETSADVLKEENVPGPANVLIEENTLGACLVADSSLDDHGNEGNPVITSPQKNSDSHVKMPDECDLHDSDQNQHELISRETYCQEDVFKLASLKAPAPLHAKVEDDAVVPPYDLKDDISVPSNRSSSVTFATQQEELGNAVASDDHPDSIETGMSPVDSAQPSDMKELTSSSEEHAAVSVIEQLDLDKSSTTSECVKELHPQRHPDNGSSRQEETEAISLSLESGVDGSLQQELNPTVSKADDIIERDIPHLSDPFALGLRHHADCPKHVLADARLNENQETPFNSQCSRANALHASAAAVEMLTTDSLESAHCGAPTETLCFHDLETSNKNMNLLNEALMPEMQQISYPMEDKGRTSDHQGSQSKVEASVSLQLRPYVQSSEDTDDLNIAQKTVHVLSYEKAHVSNYSHTPSSSPSECNQSVADKNFMLLESSENINMHDSSFTNKPYSGDSGLLRSSFNCSSRSLESNSNASTSLSLDVPIPEPCPVNAREKVGNGNAFNLPFPGLDTSKDALSDAPPLPPMPPLQWRLGKQGVGLQMPAAAAPGPSAGLAPGISRSVAEHPHGYPESIQNTESMNPFAAMTTFENEKSLNGHLSFGAEKESSSILPERIAAEQSRRGYGTTTVDGNAVQPSQSLATAYLGEDHYHYGPESSQAEKLHSFNPFISEPMSSDESIQQFSSYAQGQKRQSSKSSVSLPVFETRESQVIPPKLAGELIQPSNPSLSTSNTETDNYLYGRVNFGGERIQAMDLSTSSSMALGYMPQQLFFATGGENAYAPYTFFPEMDAQRRNGKPSSILNRPRDPLIEAVASHDRSMLRKVSEMPPTSSKPKVGERNVLLEQIKNKSFSLKSAAVTKPNVSRPPTNLKVAAILEKANAIRQACVGSDEDDEDNWSDC